MTVQYAVVAFPRLAAGEQIEAVRRLFDPLASVLPAHVTLVFPFADHALLPLLEQHVRGAVAGTAAFDLTLTAPTAADAGYLFLNVAEGAEPLVELHRRLYAGALAPHRSTAHVYQPHVTVGRLGTPEQLAAAAAAAQAALPAPSGGRIHEVAIFALDELQSGAVQCTVPLR